MPYDEYILVVNTGREHCEVVFSKENWFRAYREYRRSVRANYTTVQLVKRTHTASGAFLTETLKQHMSREKAQELKAQQKERRKAMKEAERAKKAGKGRGQQWTL